MVGDSLVEVVHPRMGYTMRITPETAELVKRDAWPWVGEGFAGTEMPVRTQRDCKRWIRPGLAKDWPNGVCTAMWYSTQKGFDKPKARD
jgi:hypothetical protein